MDDFRAPGIPGAPALGPTELDDDPHLQARGMLFDEDHPVAGRFHTLSNPVLVDGQEFAVRHAPRWVNTPTRCCRVSGTAEEMADLHARGVI